jgi:AcrR family transcriptional regulator
MAVAVARSPRGAPRGSRYEKLRCGVRGPKGLTREQVEDNQRTRLYEAMIEITVARGYHATTIKEASALAGVSRRTFYDLFGAGPRPKDACFLGAYDYVVDRALERISQAYRDERDPGRRLCRAFEQFAAEAVSEPRAARLVLVEVLGAGRAAFDRMERGRSLFERLVAASVGDPGSEETLSPAVAKGIVGGVERISRVRLLDGRIDELSATAEELSAWVSSYRPWSPPARTEARPAAAVRPRIGLRSRDEGLRIVRAAAAIAASDGYSRLSAGRIVQLAEASDETFASMYDGPNAIEACFLAAFDLLGAETLVCAAKASRSAGGWPDGVRDGIAALLDHVAGHPFLGRVAFVEIFAVGPSAIEHRSRLLGKFADVLVGRIPEDQRPSELVAEAIVGGIWAIVHDYVVRGQLHRLHELVDDATYLALAPVLGHEEATRLILDGSQEPAADGVRRSATAVAADIR